MISRRFSEFLSRLRRGVREADRERLAAILQLNRGLAGARDPRDLLVRLLDEAIALFAAERGFVILRGGEHTDFDMEVARSLDREAVRNPRQKISSTVVSRCLDGREGVYCEDAQEGDFGAAQSVADLKLRSVLCMPLVAGENCLGCIYLDHRFQAGVFQEADLPWLQAFADQGAIALNLHQLVQENKAHAAVVETQNRELQATVKSQAETLQSLTPLSRELLQHPYSEIFGESRALLRSLHLLDRIMASDFSVFVIGDSGTGKELTARALHRYGPRANRSFVAVNVAAISPGLLESELFGHVRGAFTGADRDRTGLLREAEGGVLFLDEVTEMALDMQVKLLGFLEDSTVRPVGSDKTYTVDLRVVAACNRDPHEEIALGRFRRDLYYRLAVVTVELPPLRERREDIPMLVERFFAMAATARGDGVGPVRPTEELLQEMIRRSWHGNLRQLRNEVLRLDALADGGVVGIECLTAEPKDNADRLDIPPLDLASVERHAIENALQATGGNKAEAARLLGISRRALYNKLERIERDA